MKHPPYHLRPNKIIERFTFIDAIRRLEQLGDNGLSGYTYYGMGGPFLEDFRLLYESYPNINMISIEKNGATVKRQKFHLPSRNIQLKHIDSTSFISQFNPNNSQSIFWLDYTNLVYQHFGDFQTLLNVVEELSMIKITLLCDPRRYRHPTDDDCQESNTENFYAEFENVLPPNITSFPSNHRKFAKLLQEMLKTASEQALHPSATTLMFVPVSSFYYRDATDIFTLTGIVCKSENQKRIRSVYKNWPFANLDWSPPKQIDVPTLSTKERLHIQHLLPLSSNAGPTLLNALGYRIHQNTAKTQQSLEQYADFHQYSPHIMKTVP